MFEAGNSFLVKANIWNSIRLFLAALVIYGHSFAISPDGKSQDLFIWITRGITWSGDLAVIAFFFISGMFITQSTLSSPSPFQFIKKRIYRIYPALLLCLLVNTFVLVPIFNPGVMRFSELIHYCFQNSLAITNEHFVQNVWTSHADKSLNGVLWSITLEVRLYFVLFVFFALLFCLRKMSKKSMLFFQVILFLCIVLVPDNTFLLGSEPSSLGNPVFPLHVCIFLSGGIFSLLNVNSRAVAALFLCSSLIWIFAGKSFNSIYFLYISVIALLLLVSIWKRLQWINPKNYYSYGLYLWGWPIQQCIKAFQDKGYVPSGTIYNFICSFIVAMGFAYLSWHLLEKHALTRAKSSKI